MDGWFHGTLQGYQRMKCRCAECKLARREYMQAWRAKNRERLNARQRDDRAAEPERFRSYGKAWRERVKVEDPDRLRDDEGAKRERARSKLGTGDFPHGPSGYLLGCKCDTCRTERADYLETWRAGKVEQTPHGTSNGYDNYGCRCVDCTAAHSARSTRSKKVVNSKTLETATRHGDQWSGADLEIITTRTDLTIAQLAVMLGRSAAAVANARRRALTEPKYRKAAGVDDA